MRDLSEEEVGTYAEAVARAYLLGISEVFSDLMYTWNSLVDVIPHPPIFSVYLEDQNGGPILDMRTEHARAEIVKITTGPTHEYDLKNGDINIALQRSLMSDDFDFFIIGMRRADQNINHSFNHDFSNLAQFKKQIPQIREELDQIFYEGLLTPVPGE